MPTTMPAWKIPASNREDGVRKDPPFFQMDSDLKGLIA